MQPQAAVSPRFIIRMQTQVPVIRIPHIPARLKKSGLTVCPVPCIIPSTMIGIP